VCAIPPGPGWLRGAGLDAAILVDGAEGERGEIVGADGTRRPVRPDVETVAAMMLQGGS
jgi:hypothetical protein